MHKITGTPTIQVMENWKSQGNLNGQGRSGIKKNNRNVIKSQKSHVIRQVQ